MIEQVADISVSDGSQEEGLSGNPWAASRLKKLRVNALSIKRHMSRNIYATANLQWP
jgi:hypothetical protein